MKISLNWLTDYVDATMPAAELAALLMRIGLPVEEIEEKDNDIVLDVEVTSNRPDCLGHIGIAREVATATGLSLRLPDLAGPVGAPVAGQTAVEVLDPAFCPRYTARLLRGVKVGPSPAWMVERLEAIGVRSINNVVDATNYVLMEYSQPLHAFDFDKLHGGRIVVRRARDGETIVAIDGSRHTLHGWMGIIADADRPVAVAGVMGGLDTEVSDATVNVLMEGAQFDPLSIRRTSRELGLMSDASYRYERGIDPVRLDDASLRACRLILGMAGGELLEGVVDAWAQPYRPARVSLRPARTNRVLGIEVPRDRQRTLLASLGLEPRDEGEALACTIPPHRRDLEREIDLIEEVARLHGFDQIPTGAKVTHEVRPPTRTEAGRHMVGEVLTAAGYFEAITFTFVDAEEARLFGWEHPLAVDPRIRKANNTLRQGVLPSLLRARKANQDAGNANVSLYELAAVFPPRDSGLPDEHVQVALLTDGSLQDVRGAVEAVARRFCPAATVEVRAAAVKGFAPGAAAELRLTGAGEELAARPFGVMGVMDDTVRDFYGLAHAPAGAMIRFDLLLAGAGGARKYQAMSRFPSIERDLSVVVDEAVTWAELAAAARATADRLCTGIGYVTTYRGKQVGADRKSVTLRLTYRHPERTLRHEEVDASVATVVQALQQRFQAALRT